MKLWEAIKELTDNPKKMFTHQDSENKWMLYTDFIEGHRKWRPIFMLECVDDENKNITTLFYGNFSGNIYMDTDWQEVKQPVTWQEAIQAWAEGNRVMVEYELLGGIVKHGKNPFSEQVSVNRDEIIQGTWYIED